MIWSRAPSDMKRSRSLINPLSIEGSEPPRLWANSWITFSFSALCKSAKIIPFACALSSAAGIAKKSAAVILTHSGRPSNGLSTIHRPRVMRMPASVATMRSANISSTRAMPSNSARSVISSRYAIHSPTTEARTTLNETRATRSSDSGFSILSVYALSAAPASPTSSFGRNRYAAGR